jgi:D-amino-acid dehydrogenase
VPRSIGATESEEGFMARTDVVVLGAGIVGVSCALHLAKRGVAVVLVDRNGPGEGTSYGNAGVIEGNTIFPYPFPSNFGALLRIALKRATEADYHMSYLLRVWPWLLVYRANSSPERLAETAQLMRPLFARARAEHEVLLGEAGATRYLRSDGWLKVYRSDAAFAALDRELDLAGKFSVPFLKLRPEDALGLEPSLSPVFRHATFWPQAASVTNPLAVSKAYAERFAALGGITLEADARSLRRQGLSWRVETGAGPLDAEAVVVALGPWAPDVLVPLGVRLPFAIKRGYHQHFHPAAGATLKRPVLDVEVGYVLAPMEQGIRLTTGAEFADRDAPPTPMQLGRVLPHARQLFPLGEPAEPAPWMGSRPCFADSRPVIGRAPGVPGLWLAAGHAHWGLTLGPVTGRLLAEMMTGAKTFCDPAPYRAGRF